MIKIYLIDVFLVTYYKRSIDKGNNNRKRKIEAE